jgi:DNA (cytosine-5)-methyltransferase 1
VRRIVAEGGGLMAAVTGTTEPIRYLDVCSGYSAFTVASEGLGFDCAGYAEIDAFPSALLGAHYGATRARYMPDPDAGGIGLKERLSRLKLRKSMAALNDSHFGNRIINFGDFTQIRADDVGPIDLLIGGTPCQAFSVAGQRLGLDDPRGNLTLEFLALAKRVRASWLAWENVPGFLSHDKGRTLGTFLGLLGQLGYGWAYRVLDAQYIRVDRFARAVPQRRKRVILVAHLGDAAGPAAVLFERESLRGDPAPRRETGEGVAPTISARTKGGGGLGTDFDCDGGLIADVACTLPAGGNSTGGARQPGMGAETAATMLIAKCLTAPRTGAGGSYRGDPETETLVAHPVAATLTRGSESSGVGSYAGRRQEDDVNLVAHTLLSKSNDSHAADLNTYVAHALRAEGFDASEDGTGRGTPIVPVYAINSDCLDRSGEGASGTAGERAGLGVQAEVAYAMRSKRPDAVAIGGESWAVRRLTPTECERLMGVPDGFTAITYRGKPAADGPRYKALGNSQAANMMRWVAHGLADVIAAQRACGMDVAA